jgi:hypothetical protein
MYLSQWSALTAAFFAASLTFGAAPAVQTLTPVSVTETSAVIRANVFPFNRQTTAWFVWGTTTNYGNITSAASVPASASSWLLTNVLGGLSPGTTYHYRGVAFNLDGTATGADVEFTTVGSSAIPANAIRAQRVGTNAVFTFRGTPGATYLIQATTNLVQPPSSIQWTEAGSRTADANGEFQFSVSVTNGPRRFFRTVYP